MMLVQKMIHNLYIWINPFQIAQFRLLDLQLVLFAMAAILFLVQIVIHVMMIMTVKHVQIAVWVVVHYAIQVYICLMEHVQRMMMIIKQIFVTGDALLVVYLMLEIVLNVPI